MPRKTTPKKSPPPTKTPRSNPFKDAVDAASRQLEMALEEQSLCHNKLAHLAILIPKLERTVMALRDQMSPHEVKAVQTNFQPYVPSNLPTLSSGGSGNSGAHIATLPSSVWRERDLSGLGSIPPVQGAPQVPISLSDDELLSDDLPEGEEIL